MSWKKRAASIMIAVGMLLSAHSAVAVDMNGSIGTLEEPTATKKFVVNKGVDPGSSIADALKINLDTSYEGSISDSNTRDFYSFTLSRPTTATVSATAHVMYINYKIYDEKGNEVVSWRPTWNASTKISMVKEERQLSAGTYYFCVEQYYTPLETYNGDYSFKITAGAQQRFTDVPSNAYYANAVDWAVENEITSGITATTFGPNKDCTRGQIVTMLWRAMGSPEPKSSENPFTDVKSSQYFYKPVLWAVENEVTSGTTNTTFSPNTICNRAQAMTFLWTAEGKPSTLNEIQFKDVGSGSYYYQAVRWAVKNGITSGTTATTFSPNNRCTRAQIVAFLYQTMA